MSKELGLNVKIGSSQQRSVNKWQNSFNLDIITQFGSCNILVKVKFSLEIIKLVRNASETSSRILKEELYVQDSSFLRVCNSQVSADECRR